MHKTYIYGLHGFNSFLMRITTLHVCIYFGGQFIMIIFMGEVKKHDAKMCEHLMSDSIRVYFVKFPAYKANHIPLPPFLSEQLSVYR